jgi:hypothetical protein
MLRLEVETYRSFESKPLRVPIFQPKSIRLFKQLASSCARVTRRMQIVRAVIAARI